MNKFTKTISLGAIPRCNDEIKELEIIAPHELKNFDDIVIWNLELIGVTHSYSGNPYDTITTRLTSDNFKLIVNDKFVKLMVSNNDTFFDEAYATITYMRKYDNELTPVGVKGVKKKLDLEIKKVIFNKPATIVLWEDGSKTVVKVNKGERWDKEKGLAMAIIKKKFGLKEFFKYIE